MYHRFDRRSPRGTLKAFAVSVLLHVLAGLALVFLLISDPLEAEVVEEEDEKEFEVVAVIEEEGFLEEVAQDSNEEAPSEAELVSDQTNAVEEEAQAEVTSPDKVEDPAEENTEDVADNQVPEETSDRDRLQAELEMPEPPVPAAAVVPPEVELPPVEVAPPDLAEEVLEDWSEEDYLNEFADEVMDDLVVERDPAPRPPPDPRSLFNPEFDKYEEMFGARDDTLRDRERHDPNQRRLLANWKDNEKAMRASLENFNINVKPGNHTNVNAHAARDSYLAKIHRHIHVHWAHGFIHNANNNMPPGHPLNKMTLNTLVELVIDGRSGKLEEVNIVRSSGELTYDAEVILVARRIGRHANAPKEVVSPDGRVYIHWNFWRDQRQCGPFGAKIFVVDS